MSEPTTQEHILLVPVVALTLPVLAVVIVAAIGYIAGPVGEPIGSDRNTDRQNSEK